MPAVMTLGGIALAALGLLITFLGMPDRMGGVSLGSDLIQAGATIFAGGLVIAALGQVLKALRDVAERVEEAGFGLSSPRQSLNDGLSDTAPIPLPRAARSAPAAALDDDFAEQHLTPSSRESRTPRAQQPAPRTAEMQRPQPRAQGRHARQAAANTDAQQQDGLTDEFSAERQNPRAEPRWMRTQAETGSRQQTPGVIPMQSNRAPLTTSANPSRREAATAAPAYEAEPHRRPTAQQQPEEIEQGEPTVVRSGIIGGMAYTLYSDRSIEAELPAGTVRFGSIEELQEHVKRAGVEEQDEYHGPAGAQH